MMKIVLLDTRNGLMLQGEGKYTPNLQSALGFENPALAAEFRERQRLVHHNVALRFSDASVEFIKSHVRN